MNNFLEFIEKDIEAKKVLIGTLPVKTKTNKKKLNETLDDILEKYEDYKLNTKNYLIAKCRSLEIKEDKDSTDKIKSRIEALEQVKFLLNPTNSYFEKMGFDTLMYQINNFDTFNFDSLNDIINGFLDKFELVGISLKSNDFDYTCYVHEYMSSFLDVRYHVTKSYDKTSEIFEQIYWVNPEIINHIELNFRKLIDLNEKKFNNYILSLQKDVMKKNNISNYAICLEKLKDAYIDMNMSDNETISDIIDLAKSDSINVEQYFEDNKIRQTAFSSLIPEGIDYSNPEILKKICISLEKLKINIEEYNNFIEFEKIFANFRDEYSKLLPENDKKEEYKGLKEVISEILKKEAELDKLNKKIFGGKPGLFEFKNDLDLKRLKSESIVRAKELYELYKKYDIEYFNKKILEVLNKGLTIADVLNLYYSFDYFKKLVIQKVYNLKEYGLIVEYSENFDIFAMNPTNVIITGVPVFGESNISRNMANKYKLSGIKIEEEDLSPENLSSLINKILMILRINIINNSDISVEELWFISQVEKIVKKELKKNN